MVSRELSLRQHLEELRRRVFFSLVALLIGSAVAFAFYKQIIQFLIMPARDLHTGGEAQLVFIEVTELLTTSFKVSIIAGFMLASPVILYQAIRFVAPGLTRRERRYLLAFLPGVALAFAGGVAFGYFVMVPPALHFLITFGDDLATPMIRISNLVNLMIRLLFWLGLAFETPVVMFLLAQLGIANARAYSRFRKYWIIVAFALGAIITPTFDPVNQSLVALPLIALYEIGILLARLAGWRRRAAASAANGNQS